MIAIVLAMAVAAAGCGGDSGGGDDEDLDAGGATQGTTASTAAPAPSTTAGSTVPATTLTLRMTDLRLTNSEEADSGMRVLLPAGVTTASVTITSGLPTPNRVISVCQADVLDRRMSAAACRMPANGEAVNVALGTAAKGVEIAQVGVSASGPEGNNTTTLPEVTIRYAASAREVDVRLQQVASGESTIRPTFSLTPASSNGAYRATLTWRTIPVFGGTDSRAQLELLVGGTPSGQPQTGTTEVRLTGTVPPPVGDVALRVQNVGSAALVTPTLNLLLP